jgi:hypothetical protein
MNPYDEKEIRELLKTAIGKMPDAELRRDLWPLMQRRLDDAPLRVPWWDWALLAAAVSVFCFFPGVIPALLYHL